MQTFTTINDVASYLSDRIVNGYETTGDRELLGNADVVASIFNDCGIAYGELVDDDDPRLTNLCNAMIGAVIDGGSGPRIEQSTTLRLIADLVDAIGHLLYSVAIRSVISDSENRAIVHKLDAITDRIKVMNNDLDDRSKG